MKIRKIGEKSGPPPKKGPNSQGLDATKKKGSGKKPFFLQNKKKKGM